VKVKNGQVVSRKTVSVPGKARAVTLRLQRGRYRFTVRAVNAIGRSKAAVTKVVIAR